MTNAEAPFSAGLHIQPQYDPLEHLPPAAADRLRALRQRSADAHMLVPAFESIREASMARVAAENTLRRLTDHPQAGGFALKPDSRQVTEARRTLDKATDHFPKAASVVGAANGAMAIVLAGAGRVRGMAAPRQATGHGA